jgi:hypothetical protein
MIQFIIHGSATTSSWTINSISRDLASRVIYSSSAHAIWLDLKERFQQSNGPRVFKLKCDLMGLLQGMLTVSQYFLKLKSLWEELIEHRSTHTCHCGGAKQLLNYLNMEYVLAFLMGLNESYSQVRGQVLLMDLVPLINKVFSLIHQEVKQREIGAPSVETNSTLAYAVQASFAQYGSS